MSATGTAAACASLILAAMQVPAQTPEQQQLWDAQRAQAQSEAAARAEKLAQQRAARRAEPMAWVRSLDPLPAGGWQFRTVSNDGSWAAFSTDHQLKRSGRQVTVWLRQEYSEPQRNNNGESYLSNSEKVQYDCGNERARVFLVVYFTLNNLSGSQTSEETETRQASWTPIVPGTQTESLYQWACAAMK
jgi:hypothetical protein